MTLHTMKPAGSHDPVARLVVGLGWLWGQRRAEGLKGATGMGADAYSDTLELLRDLEQFLMLYNEFGECPLCFKSPDSMASYKP